MEKSEYRAVIKYLHLKKLTPKEIHDDMTQTLGATCPSYSTVKQWCADFKRGRRSTEDEPRPGRPCEVTTEENVNAVLDTIMQDRRVTIRQLASHNSIPKTSVERIIHDHLHMNKVSARWVPRMLTEDQKRKRVVISQELLQDYQADADAFLSHVVTQDETWVHHFDPETKSQSMQWKHVTSPTPKKFKSTPSSGKVMASVFWDAEGVIMIDYLQKGKTINGQYYADELRQLREKIKEKRRGKLRRGVWLLQDNAPVHTSQVAVSVAQQCGFKILPHPAYSPDLAPSDFYLFPQLKAQLRGRKFETDDDVIGAVEAFLGSCDKNWFRTGLMMLEKRWMKCIEVKGDYVEK